MRRGASMSYGPPGGRPRGSIPAAGVTNKHRENLKGDRLNVRPDQMDVTDVINIQG